LKVDFIIDSKILIAKILPIPFLRDLLKSDLKDGKVEAPDLLVKSACHKDMS
jgi:hypothetical protein